MGLKRSILAKLYEKSKPVKKSKPKKEVSNGEPVTGHVKQFRRMEGYLCNLLGVDVRELDIRIMAWAQKKPLRWKKYEKLVRAGERLKELQFYAQNVKPKGGKK